MVEEFDEDYASMVGRLVPERDRLQDEESKELVEIRNQLIKFADKIAKKRVAMYNNNDPYAYLFVNDMILQQFFIMLFHNKHKAYYDILLKIKEELEKKQLDKNDGE